ncbi:MAG: hypothetical protein J5884_01690 [Paludibacteraceae bacterium]|nr:hypothetical protein [Paludibacteraceae bacterium]
MKKSLLIVAALFAAFTLSAKEFAIDLSKAEVVLSDPADEASFSVADGVITVNINAKAGWHHLGVAFPLNNFTNVTNIAYEYKGDGAVALKPDGIVLYPYLVDNEDVRWYKEEYWPNMLNTDWQPETMLPNKSWDATSAFGGQTYVKFAVVAQPSAAYTGKFYLRNIKITADAGTGIDEVSQEPKANSQKLIRDGQLVIIRNGLEYNAAGQELK